MALKIFVVTAGDGVELEPIVATYSQEDAETIKSDFETDGIQSKIFPVALIGKSDGLKFRKVYSESKVFKSEYISKINGEEPNDK